MPLSSQSLKGLLAAALLVGAGIWMWHTWGVYHPDSSPQPPPRRSSTTQAEARAELTPEQRRQRQHRALYRRLEMTQEQRQEANAVATRLTEAGDYREAEFRRERRDILTVEQVIALEEWLRERREARQARQTD
jgi:hypothetical protein